MSLTFACVQRKQRGSKDAEGLPRSRQRLVPDYRVRL